MVPPEPHDAIADVMAGTSSVEEEPPAFGVQVEARALRVLVEGREKAKGRIEKKLNSFIILSVMIYAIYAI